MFSKVSVYDFIDVFMFLNQEIQEIYQQYQVNKCYLYPNLTDTDSTSMFFVFIYIFFFLWKKKMRLKQLHK